MAIILNMKADAQLKHAVRVAALQAGFPNSSQFMLSIIRENPYVKKELSKKPKIN